MADFVITPADVKLVALSDITAVQVGEAVVAGEVGYLAADRKYYLTNATDAAKFDASVMFVTDAALDGVAVAISPGTQVAVGAVAGLASGTLLMLSDTPGKLKPVADASTGDYPVLVGIGASSSAIDFNPVISTNIVP